MLFKKLVIVTARLVVQGVVNPLCSAMRINKFQ